jgi:hypothetical protein
LLLKRSITVTLHKKDVLLRKNPKNAHLRNRNLHPKKNVTNVPRKNLKKNAINALRKNLEINVTNVLRENQNANLRKNQKNVLLLNRNAIIRIY